MCNPATPVVLVQDAAISSERDGSKAIYWSSDSTWAAFTGASAFDIAWRVYSGDLNAEARIYPQTSLDGITWEDPGFEAAGLLSAPIVPGSAGRARIYLNSAITSSPFLRIGVEVVQNTITSPVPPAKQVELRLTLVITPTHGSGDVVLAENMNLKDQIADFVIGAPFVTIDADQLSLFGDGSSASALVAFDLYTSRSQGGPWLKVGSSFTLALSGSTLGPTIKSFDKTQLSSFAQLQLVNNGPSTDTFINVTATIRTR